MSLFAEQQLSPFGCISTAGAILALPVVYLQLHDLSLFPRPRSQGSVATHVQPTSGAKTDKGISDDDQHAAVNHNASPAENHGQ